MARCAVLVDAGYLLGAASTLVVGDANRAQICVDYPALIKELIDEAERQSGLPVLRLLWYDGAFSSQPTPEHRIIRILPDVKLRLGELVRREGRVQQKGVDSYLQRDLTTLARNHAVADVILVGGDEDLRRALEEAQDYGLRVHLWGVEAAAPEYNQSESLIAEADRRQILSADWVRRFIRKAEEPVGMQPETEQPAEQAIQIVPAKMIQSEAPSTLASPADLARLVTHFGGSAHADAASVSGGWAVIRDTDDIPRLRDMTSPPQAWRDNESDATASTGDPVEIGSTFGRRWASRATGTQRSTLLSRRPILPSALDGELLRYANRLGVDTWEDETAKFAVRGAFWEAIASTTPEEDNGQQPD